jgi:hypothetical protein
MKKLPDHSPKTSAWDDILKRMDFDSQVSGHVPNLPQFSPKDGTWEKIAAELESKKIVPIWMPWSAAAGVVAILLLAMFGLKNSNEEIEKQPLTSELPAKSAQRTAETASPEPLTQGEIAEANPKTIPQKPTSEKKPEPMVAIIEVPEMSLPEVELWQSKNISLQLPEEQSKDSVPAKTLHQVSISWSKIKPGLQVKTSFGRAEAELEQKPQASTDRRAPLTLEINN